MWAGAKRRAGNMRAKGWDRMAKRLLVLPRPNTGVLSGSDAQPIEGRYTVEYSYNCRTAGPSGRRMQRRTPPVDRSISQFQVFGDPMNAFRLDLWYMTSLLRSISLFFSSNTGS